MDPDDPFFHFLFWNVDGDEGVFMGEIKGEDLFFDFLERRGGDGALEKGFELFFELF